jgi:Spirocyclase AveC-like
MQTAKGMFATHAHDSAVPATQSFPRVGRVTIWASIGVAILLFQLYVLIRWVCGPYFTPTNPGSDPISASQQTYFLLLQIAVTVAAVICLIKWLIVPWWREGEMTSSGRLFAAGAMIFFWDLGMNFTSTVLFYNSHLVNYGAWALGSWPGWVSPDGNLLPEPVFITIPGYTSLVTTQAIFVCWLLRKAKERWPGLGVMPQLGIILVGCTVVDSIIEIALLKTGAYAYPGAVRSLTLFAGKTYQFPLYEGFLFGGLGVGAMTALHHFRDDKGFTYAEKGIDQMNMGKAGKQWIRGLAVYGFCHLLFLSLYTIPMQFFSLNSDPFPEGYPSYMVNGMCTYGIHRNQCPGPGVMMPRL